MELFRKVTNDIVRDGQSVIHVFAGPSGQLPFFYTIGNHERGLPELLLVANLDPLVGMRMLNELGRIQRERGRAFGHREEVSLGGDQPVTTVHARRQTVRTDYACMAFGYYDGQDVRVVQVLLCDEEGRLPGEPGCDPAFDTQPRLDRLDS